MHLVAPHVSWHKPQHVLINWCARDALHLNRTFRELLIMCELYLVCDMHQPHVLRVHKCRSICLSLHAPVLDELFEAYDMDLSSWRGHITISDSDRIRYLLCMN